MSDETLKSPENGRMDVLRTGFQSNGVDVHINRLMYNSAPLDYMGHNNFSLSVQEPREDLPGVPGDVIYTLGGAYRWVYTDSSPAGRANAEAVNAKVTEIMKDIRLDGVFTSAEEADLQYVVQDLFDDNRLNASTANKPAGFSRY